MEWAEPQLPLRRAESLSVRATLFSDCPCFLGQKVKDACLVGQAVFFLVERGLIVYNLFTQDSVFFQTNDMIVGFLLPDWEPIAVPKDVVDEVFMKEKLDLASTRISTTDQQGKAPA